MKRVPRSIRLTLLSLALLPLAPASSARQWTRAEFALDQGRPEKLVLLPPISHIVRAKVTESEPMIKESEAFERELADHVGQSLRARGYSVDTESLSPRALAADPELSERARRVRERVEETLPQFHESRKGIVTGRYSIGEVAAPLAAATGAEGFLVLYAYSVIPSKGNKALGVILGGGYPQTSSYVQAVLVDASSGVFEAVMFGAATGGVLKAPDKVAAAVVESALAGYPSKGELGKVKKAKKAKKGTPDVASTPEEPVEDQDQVLAEFEAIYAERTAAPTVREPREIFDAPAESRPQPTARVSFETSPSESATVLRNSTSQALRVSIDLAPWTALGPGAELRLQLAAGSHTILAVDDVGNEITRGEWVIEGNGFELAEILAP